MACQPWYSWRRKPGLEFIKKWSLPKDDIEERWATFASDPAVCPNNTWRDNDVFVSTFMRSGTHFIWFIVRMILQRSAEPIRDLMFDSHTCFKLFKEDNHQNDLPVRVLSGHELPIVLSPDVILNGNRKFICIIRNPKDVLTSLTFFLKRHTGIFKEMESMDDVIADWCNNVAQPCGSSWYHHTRAWEQFIQEHPEAPILPMMYENFIKYPEKCIKQVAAFLGVDLAANLVKEIAEATKFAKLVTAERSDKNEMFVDGAETPMFYRKGIIGDWKNVLTVSQNKMVDAATERLMDGSNIRLIYE